MAAGTARGGWARWTTFIDPADGGSEVRVSLEYELPGEIVRSVLGALTGSRASAGVSSDVSEPQASRRG